MTSAVRSDPTAAEDRSLSVGAAAARLGVAPATLRSWGRRYGLIAEDRSEGGHRRYSAADLSRLVRMQELVGTGLSPARAARVALHGDSNSSSEWPGADKARRRGGPGGRVLAVPGTVAEVRGLARAVSRLDADLAVGQIGDLLVQRGVLATWDDVLCPVLMAAGARWGRTGGGIEVEHVLSEAIIEALRAYRAFLPRPAPARPALLACAPEEQHTLPLHAVAGALAEMHVPVRLLGARTPAISLLDAARRTGAAAIFIWRQAPDPDGRYDELNGLMRVRPNALVVVGGPGWTALPGFARRAPDLRAALALLRGPWRP